MKHVSLDAQDNAIKDFVLGLSGDPSGAVLELHGRAVACVVPVQCGKGNGAPAEPWTDARNARRCDLVDREIDGTLTPEEAAELQQLQQEMRQYLRRVAPLPLADARLPHQELLARARAASEANS